ncbi:MAG: hypothetical protein ACOX9B_11315 [Candidatus Xenobium sp.]|jgi:hypothetical protein|nr:hypothetical protein [Burkholderiales bacterium]
MNEIHGFGPVQPLRPGTTRPQPPTGGPEASLPVAKDLVHLRVDLPASKPLAGLGKSPAELPNGLPASPKSELPSGLPSLPETRLPESLPTLPSAQFQPTWSEGGQVVFSREVPRRDVQSFDGFLVAGGPGSANATSLTPQVNVSGLGPIAMIDEPSHSAPSVQFPELSLNGPSNVQEGIYGLSGTRLA